ncbi:MAG: hypothetical protein U9R01_05995, partial [candidate division WOR-3 bacterium]|nr:hypothetical protein [candidate division WOR-3 bacterium]
MWEASLVRAVWPDADNPIAGRVKVRRPFPQGALFFCTAFFEASFLLGPPRGIAIILLGKLRVIGYIPRGKQK